MRILLIEDSAPLRKPVVKALKASGFAVDATGDGLEGWQMAQDHDYDVIVLDIMLPGLDGREILKRLTRAFLREAVAGTFKVSPYLWREKTVDWISKRGIALAPALPLAIA